MSPSFTLLERVQRNAPLGLRFWDLAAGTAVAEGLQVDVFARRNPQAGVRAFSNRSGIYCAIGLPGLRDFEFSSADDDASWLAALRPYRVEVRDPLGRFLPFAFDADAPVRGLFAGLPPLTATPYPLPWLAGSMSPPPALMTGIPLFSAPSRPVPEPLAQVRAQLFESGAGRLSAWSLLAAHVDGRLAGVGMADDQGRVALLFPYPQRPRPMLLTSPPPARNDFRWSIEFSAHCVPRAAATAAPELPSIDQLLAQLATPRTLLAATLPAARPLGPQLLEYRVPLTCAPTSARPGRRRPCSSMRSEPASTGRLEE